MSNGSTPAGNTTQTQTAPAYMLPFMGTAAGQAANLLQSGGINPYPGQQVASFNPIQSSAFKGITGLDKNLMQGSGNPYENQMFQQEMQQVQPQLASQFAGSGRDIVGSMPLAQQQLGNMGAQFYGQQYQNDVQNAMNAGQQQLGIGNQIQGQGQNLIDASMRTYNQAQQQPYQNLQQYESFLSGLQPGQQTLSPYFTNPMATGAGALIAGKQLFGGSKGGASTAAGG